MLFKNMYSFIIYIYIYEIETFLYFVFGEFWWPFRLLDK